MRGALSFGPRRLAQIKSATCASVSVAYSRRDISCSTMHAADAAGDHLRLVEHYRQMKDPELLVLLRDLNGLTDLARQVLGAEVHQRGLQPEPEEPAAPIPEPSEHFFGPSSGPSSTDVSDEPDSYEEERKLVELCNVWSLRDALQLQTLLDRPGIPFFMGPEKATGVADVTSNFTKGLSVQIMQVAIPWVQEPMSHYEPKDEPPDVAQEEIKEDPIRCPKCQSEDVIFNGLVTELPDDEFPSATAESESTSSPSVADPPQKFTWTCDSCGYEWKDDGVASSQ
jgi:DNA-directed RNA polymerase subunit M/transcription elongation factor TFIIS